jgi:hypothetical protein
MRNPAIRQARPATVLTLLVAILAGATAANAAEFPTVVRAILDSQTTGRLAAMSPDKRVRMTDCVIATLNGLPSGKKRYIVEGKNLDEQEDRFGQVVDEDNAKWRQNIARACASIAMGQDQPRNR